MKHPADDVAVALRCCRFPGEGAAAIADVLYGKLSPSGRTPVSWHRDADYARWAGRVLSRSWERVAVVPWARAAHARQYVPPSFWLTRLSSPAAAAPSSPHCSIPMTNMAMRASGSYPGRTHRYWRGPQPLYPFGHGLSYTTWELSKAAVVKYGAAAAAKVVLKNSGGVASDASVLLFMAFLGADAGAGGAALPRFTLAGSGCGKTATRTDLVQSLVGYRRVAALQPGASKQLAFPLTLAGGTTSSWFAFGEPGKPPCGTYGLRFGQDQPVSAAVVLAS